MEVPELAQSCPCGYDPLIEAAIDDGGANWSRQTGEVVRIIRITDASMATLLIRLVDSRPKGWRSHGEG